IQARVPGAWHAAGDSHGQRLALRHEHVGRTFAAEYLVDPPWHVSRAHCARVPAGEWASRTHAPHAEGCYGQTAEGEHVSATAGIQQLPEGIQRSAPASGFAAWAMPNRRALRIVA